jgi:hypothetical protein
LLSGKKKKKTGNPDALQALPKPESISLKIHLCDCAYKAGPRSDTCKGEKKAAGRGHTSHLFLGPNQRASTCTALLHRVYRRSCKSLSQFMRLWYTELHRVLTGEDVTLARGIDLHEVAHGGIDEHGYSLWNAITSTESSIRMCSHIARNA